MNDLRSIIAHILEHKQHLAKANEATAQQYVVLPILRALGWDDTNLASMEILPEYQVEGRRADYALHVKHRQRPIVLIECKRWDQSIERNQQQICFYAYSGNIPLAIITNGKLWRFYLSRWEAPSLSDRIFCEIDIEEREDAISDLEKYLLKSNVASGEAEVDAEIALEEKEEIGTFKPSSAKPKVDSNHAMTDNKLTHKESKRPYNSITLIGTGIWSAVEVRDSVPERFKKRCGSRYSEEMYNAFHGRSAEIINLIIEKEWKLELRFRDVINSLFGCGFFLGYRGVLKIERPFGLTLSGKSPFTIFVRIMEEEAEQLKHQYGCEFCRISKYKTVDFVYYDIPDNISDLLPVLEFAYNKHRRN